MVARSQKKTSRPVRLSGPIVVFIHHSQFFSCRNDAQLCTNTSLKPLRRGGGVQSARARETARATAGSRAPHAMSAIPRDASRHPSGDARSPVAPPAGDGTALVRAGGERVSVAALPRALALLRAHDFAAPPRGTEDDSEEGDE